jgi:hypothetical protein
MSRTGINHGRHKRHGKKQERQSESARPERIEKLPSGFSIVPVFRVDRVFGGYCFLMLHRWECVLQWPCRRTRWNRRPHRTQRTGQIRSPRRALQSGHEDACREPPGLSGEEGLAWDSVGLGSFWLHRRSLRRRWESQIPRLRYFNPVGLGVKRAVMLPTQFHSGSPSESQAQV